MLNEHYELRVPFTVLQKWKKLGLANMDAIMHLHKLDVMCTEPQNKNDRQCFLNHLQVARRRKNE